MKYLKAALLIALILGGFVFSQEKSTDDSTTAVIEETRKVTQKDTVVTASSASDETIQDTTTDSRVFSDSLPEEITASVKIKTDPSGAQVKVGNKLIDGETPLTVVNVPVGRTTISLRKNGHFLVKSRVNITDQKPMELNFYLQKCPQLIVTSAPTEAKVELSTGETGKTPLTFTNPDAGEIRITVSKDDYNEASKEIILEYGKADTVHLNLDPIQKVTPAMSSSAANDDPRAERMPEKRKLSFIKVFGVGILTVFAFGMVGLEFAY